MPRRHIVCRSFRVVVIGLLLAAMTAPAFAQGRPPRGGGDAGTGPKAPWEVGSYDPAWADARTRTTAGIQYDKRQTDEQNGDRLYTAIGALQPGTTFKIGPGTWSIARKTSINLVGTAAAPIRIVAADDKNPPVITRPDDKQNVLNLGDGGGQATCEYLQLHGLRLTGGSSLIRLYACQQVWIDGCELDHPGAEAITANVQDTSYLHITRNHIHHMESAANTCEGMYLGANNSKARMTFSVIALNHVHDCRGTQGDGIEVKQGSHHNWIVENEIHDCNYPCITVYGTDGLGINLIERNTCYNSGDNVVQVQGEAIVRNNLMINGKAACFASHDHQGKSRALTVVHNTMINEARGAKMSSWNDREGMVFANNAVYCKTGPAIEFNGGSSGVTFVGNVAAGNVIGTTGAGDTGGVFKLAASDDVLKDFADVKFDASARDAHPNKRGSNVIGRADREHVCEFDLAGTERKRRPIAGAFDVK